LFLFVFLFYFLSTFQHLPPPLTAPPPPFTLVNIHFPLFLENKASLHQNGNHIYEILKTKFL